MRVKIVLRSLALALAVCAHGTARAAGSATDLRALQSACFPAASLEAVAGEHVARKGDRTFSTPVSRTPVAPFSPVPQGLRGAIRSVALPPGLKLIALTFDLCEDNFEVAGYEGRIFDTLRRENVKATLFTGGKWMRSHAVRATQLMSDPLFEIANHAEAHRNLRLLKSDVLQDEILGPQRAYENLRSVFAASQCVAQAPAALQSIPPRMALFRFPYGACNAESLKVVNDAGLLAIQWNVATGDPSPGTSARSIVKAMTERVKPGAIIIGHANGRGWNMPEALPLAIAELKKQGYVFVTVSELLAAGTPQIVQTCYNVSPGDTDRYDRFPALLASRSKASERAGASGWGAMTVKAEGPSVKTRRKHVSLNRKKADDRGAKPAER